MYKIEYEEPKIKQIWIGSDANTKVCLDGDILVFGSAGILAFSLSPTEAIDLQRAIGDLLDAAAPEPKTTGMTFGEAVEAMMQGKTVGQKSNRFSERYRKEGSSIVRVREFYRETVLIWGNNFFATDWEIVPEEEEK